MRAASRSVRFINQKWDQRDFHVPHQCLACCFAARRKLPHRVSPEQHNSSPRSERGEAVEAETHDGKAEGDRAKWIANKPKLKACRAEVKAKGLIGDDRWFYIQDCMSRS